MYITDKVLRFLTNVKSLSLKKCISITGAGFKYLKNIQCLDLRKVVIGDENFLEPLRGIREINLGDVFGISDNALKYFKDSHKVTLSNMTFMHSEMNMNLTYGVKYGEEELSKMMFTGKGIIHLSKVYHLNMKFIDVGDKVLSKLKCRHLSLESCVKVTLNGIKNIKELRSLKLNNTVVNSSIREIRYAMFQNGNPRCIILNPLLFESCQ